MMPSFRNAADQARHIVKKKTRHGTSRRFNRECRDFIFSLGTEVKYRGNIKRFIAWLSCRRMSISDATEVIAGEFLNELRKTCRQKTLDGYRQSINLVCSLSAEYVISDLPDVVEPRAYEHAQVVYLCSLANKALNLSIQICLHSGLRAHELHTLALPHEVQEDARRWLSERFAGRVGVRYVVIGKGGLKRTVLLRPEDAKALEQLRLPFDKVVKEREIEYKKRYSLLGGQTFSQQFSKLSRKNFGWSTGAHGLRHRYAKDRIRELQLLGFDFEFALEILAQELGHFSIANTLTYLR